jgi:hypothetical protein
MIKKMIAEVRAITGMYVYALFQHKRFKTNIKTLLNWTVCRVKIIMKTQSVKAQHMFGAENRKAVPSCGF